MKLSDLSKSNFQVSDMSTHQGCFAFDLIFLHKIYFVIPLLFLHKIYFLIPHWSHLAKAVSISGHKIRFRECD